MYVDGVAWLDEQARKHCMFNMASLRISLCMTQLTSVGRNNIGLSSKSRPSFIGADENERGKLAGRIRIQ
jgi:hypothetical protein